MYCKHCGKKLPLSDSDICTKCGKFVEKQKEPQVNPEPPKRPSKAWYLVPIFFGILGGLVMYLVLKDEDKKMAKNGLVLGIIISAVATALVIIIYGVLFSFLAFSHFHDQSYNKIIPYKPPTSNISFPGVVKFYNAADGGGVNQNRVFKSLPSTLPSSNWTVYFDYSFTSSSMPAAYPLALTSTSADPEQQGPMENAILVYHGDNSDVLHLRALSGSTITDSPGLYTGIPILPNTPYFVKLERTPTQLELSVFSDSGRTFQVPGSPVTLDIAPSDFTNLNFIQHSTSLSSGSVRTLTAEIDDTRIYEENDGYKHILFDDDYSSSAGWTQIGSSIAVNGTFLPQVHLPNYYPCNQPRFDYNVSPTLYRGNNNTITEYRNDIPIPHHTNNIPTTGLVGEWNFENNVRDTSGYGNNGYVCGNPAFVTGKIGNAMNFNAGDAVELGNPSTLNFGGTDSFSISLWMKSTQNGFGTTVDHMQNNDGAHAGYSIEDSSGSLIGRIRDSSSHDVYVTSTTNVNDGQFHHIVFVVDRSSHTENLYVDNNLQSSADISLVGDINTNFNVVFAGTVSPNTITNLYSGILDQIRIYNRTLSTSEIQSLFNEAGNTLPTVTLAAEWNFENNVLDSSGNNNNGATSGGVSFVPGKVGQAIMFDGTGVDRVPVSPTLNFGVGSFSISTWVKTTQTSIGYVVEHRTNNDGVYAGYSLEGQNGPGNLIGRIRDGGGNEVYVNTGAINDNQFHHVVFVVDRSIQTSKMYVDGNLVSSADISTVGNMDQNSIGVDVGNTDSPNTSNGPFVGQIDQLHIYNGALSQADVTSLFNEGSTSQNVIFQDDYSSNSGWIQLGNTVTVNSPSFPGIVKWNNEMGEGGTGDDRVYKQLPTILPPSNWTAYFDYQFSASSMQRSWVFDLSATPTDPWFLTSSDIITVEHGFNADQLVVELGPRGSSSSGISISPNTQYYIKLERVPTQLILSVFYDPARTINVPGSPVTLAISPNDYNNLEFIQHDGCSACGPGRTLTAQIDNTVIFTP